MVRNDNQGKKITSLKRPLWRRLLDILFVHLLFSLFLCLLHLAAGAKLADLKCVYASVYMWDVWERIHLDRLDRKLWAAGVPCVSWIQVAMVTLRGLARDGNFWLHFELECRDHVDASLLQVVWSMRCCYLPEGTLKRGKAECSLVG